MLYREWCLLPQDEEKAAVMQAWLAGQGHLGAGLLGRILAARGIDGPEAAQALMSDTAALPAPFLMQDMDKAVARIQQAIDSEEAVVVFGDYDVDGITATTLMFTYLESQGADVYYKLPNRNDDDYGLSAPMVDQMADKGITLIITVDNGTTAFEAAERARERGVSLVVTDHHLPYDELPEVDALVNPHRHDDGSGLSGLSGVGVAFMVLAALEGCPPEELLPMFGDLVAIGTVADVMKLVGPNRTLVKAGLAALQDTERPGLAALIEACGWAGKPVVAENISYGLAPRLNAAGRMDDATSALQLMLADSEEEAAPLVEGLQQQNAARQKMEQEILALIEDQLKSDTDLLRSRVLVLWGDNWHQGVIGIVASRLVDRYAKPAIVISFEGDEGKGSGRSVSGFSLHGAISACEDILIRYGGHDLAAGFSIQRAHVEDFRRRVNAWAVENEPIPALPCLSADTTVRFDELTVEAVAALELLAPCGSGNPAPRFLAQEVVLDAVYPVSEGKHSRLRLRQGESTLYAVLFGRPPEQLAYAVGDKVDVLLSLSVYDGKQGPQVSGRVIEMRPAGLTNAHAAHSALFESFYAGMVPNAEQSARLAPSREDTVRVYRLMKSGARLHYDDLRPVFCRMGEDDTGKVLCALAALEELGLIARNEATACYEPVPVEGKRDLFSSSVLKRLESSVDN